MSYWSEDARNLDVHLDVDGALQNVCRVFGVSKLFLQQKKAIKAFISRKDTLMYLGKLANGVCQVAHIFPDYFGGSP